MEMLRMRSMSRGVLRTPPPGSEGLALALIIGICRLFVGRRELASYQRRRRLSSRLTN